MEVIRPQDVIGLIPAGGIGSRIAPLPMSKELFPIGFHSYKGSGSPRPKVVSHYLLEKFAKAGIRKAFIIIREGKWDIPGYFGDGAFVNMHLGYLMMREPFGPPFTLDQAYPFVRDKVVAFGFPDILVNHKDIFEPLLEKQTKTKADVVLAILPALDPQIMDVVEIDEKGKIHAMFLKPKQTQLTLCWICAVWTPVYTQFMHEYLEEYQNDNDLQLSKISESQREDLSVGAVLQAAIKKGLNVYGVVFADGKYLDVGTPENLMRAIEMYGCQFS